MISYEDFIGMLNSFEIKYANFKVKTFSQYRNCSVYLTQLSHRSHEIYFELTPDRTEVFYFLKKFGEDTKLFKNKKVGYTLKQVWDDIEFINIEYND